jgi:hypothetical protein
MPARRGHQRRGHHPQPPPAPRRFSSDVARAPAGQSDPQLGRLGLHVRNFQGTYVRPGNSWDLRSCTQKPSESLRDFIRRFSKRCTELPSVAQSEIVHAFLEGTTCRDLVRELGRSPPADSNELFDIATSFASGEEAVGRSSMARRASARTTRPQRAASPGSPTGRTSGARKGRSRAARRASRDATATTPRPLLLTRLDGALNRPLEVRGCSTTC